MSTALYILTALLVLICLAAIFAGVIADHFRGRRQRNELRREFKRGLRAIPTPTITGRDHPLAVIGSARRGPGES